MHRKKFSAVILLIVSLAILGCENNQAAEEQKVTWGRADAKEIDIN